MVLCLLVRDLGDGRGHQHYPARPHDPHHATPRLLHLRRLLPEQEGPQKVADASRALLALLRASEWRYQDRRNWHDVYSRRWLHELHWKIARRSLIDHCPQLSFILLHVLASLRGSPACCLPSSVSRLYLTVCVSTLFKDYRRMCQASRFRCPVRLPLFAKFFPLTNPVV